MSERGWTIARCMSANAGVESRWIVCSRGGIAPGWMISWSCVVRAQCGRIDVIGNSMGESGEFLAMMPGFVASGKGWRKSQAERGRASGSGREAARRVQCVGTYCCKRQQRGPDSSEQMAACIGGAMVAVGGSFR